jgi:hypothetical protein
MERMTDITDRFLFLENHLAYVDEPLEGVARSRDSGDLFVFRSLIIMEELLWHWVLIPVDSTDADIGQTFLAATTLPPARWMSIVEDRRDGHPQLSAVWIVGRRVPLGSVVSKHGRC